MDQMPLDLVCGGMGFRAGVSSFCMGVFGRAIFSVCVLCRIRLRQVIVDASYTRFRPIGGITVFLVVIATLQLCRGKTSTFHSYVFLPLKILVVEGIAID